MNLISSLVLTVIAGIAIVNCVPLQQDTDDGSNESDSLEVFGINFRNCILNTYIQNAEAIDDFREEMLSFANQTEAITSKIGQDDFNVNEFRTVCNEGSNKIMKFLNTMKAEFSKCFSTDAIFLVNFLHNFVKDFMEFQCNLSEEQLNCKCRFKFTEYAVY
jgi:hypothetical protein